MTLYNPDRNLEEGPVEVRFTGREDQRTSFNPLARRERRDDGHCWQKERGKFMYACLSGIGKNKKEPKALILGGNKEGKMIPLFSKFWWTFVLRVCRCSFRVNRSLMAALSGPLVLSFEFSLFSRQYCPPFLESASLGKNLFSSDRRGRRDLGRGPYFLRPA